MFDFEDKTKKTNDIQRDVFISWTCCINVFIYILITYISVWYNSTIKEANKPFFLKPPA